MAQIQLDFRVLCCADPVSIELECCTGTICMGSGARRSQPVPAAVGSGYWLQRSNACWVQLPRLKLLSMQLPQLTWLPPST